MAMDHDAFEAWLNAIGGLTVEQRGLAWHALALAEAADAGQMAALPAPGGEAPAPLIGASAVSASPGGPVLPTVEVAAKAVPAPAASDTVSVVVAGQNKVDRTGCPHCAESMQTCGVHYDAMQNGALEAAF